MKNTGIIVGASVNFNYPFFGYNCIANFLIKVQSSHVKEVLEEMEKVPGLTTEHQYGSNYNLYAIARLRQLNELESRKKMISRNRHSLEIKSQLWVDVKNNPTNIFVGPFDSEDEKGNSQRHKSDENIPLGPFDLDEVDRGIVDKLTANGRAPFRKIGKELGIATDTVSRRYQRLVENNLIRSTIQIDPTKLGYQALLTFFVALTSNGEARDVANEIVNFPRVSYVAILTGTDCDLRVVALVKDFKEMYALQDKIEGVPNIKEISMSTRHPPYWPVTHMYMTTFR